MIQKETRMLKAIFFTTIIVPAFATCRKRPLAITIRYGECQPKRALVFGCRGICSSYARPSATRIEEIENSCHCCKELGTIQRRVYILCPNPGGRRPFRLEYFTVSLPIKCMCRPCSILPDEIIPSEDAFLIKRISHISNAKNMYMNQSEKIMSSDQIEKNISVDPY